MPDDLGQAPRTSGDGLTHPARSTAHDHQGRAGEHGAGPRARVVLIADSAWDALVGAALIAATVNGATRPLGAEGLRPWPLFAALGAGCLAVAGFLLYAGAETRAAAACRSVSAANMVSAVAAVGLLLGFPRLAHPYVVALAVAGIGCAIFAGLEWTAAGQR